MTKIKTYIIDVKDGLKKRGERYQKTVKLINLKQTDNVTAKNEKRQTNNNTHDTT